jgi:prepilin-type N-terminal cleavage/methylation domain-containing protein
MVRRSAHPDLKGFSLIELSIAMGVIAVLTTAILPVAIRSIEVKAGEKTITEVVLIHDAARKFYKDYKSWPSDMAQLQTQGYVGSGWSLLNPWNNPYKVSSASKTFSVSTTVPESLLGMIAARLPQSSMDALTVTSTIGTGTQESISPGVIVVWSGMIADIPSGWNLCDGSNGTPDLRDKFIIGARQDDQQKAKTTVTGALSQTGGSVSHNHGAQTGSHVLTIAEIPSHSHGYYRPHIGGRYDGHSSQVVTDMQWTQTESVGGGKGHDHSIEANSHLPPYYALAFIMKL